VEVEVGSGRQRLVLLLLVLVLVLRVLGHQHSVVQLGPSRAARLVGLRLGSV
jgi:hypothetical protein